MRSPSPLVIAGQPLPFESGIDSSSINLVPAHTFLHPQLIYPHYIRDAMNTFIPPPPSKISNKLNIVNILLNVYFCLGNIKVIPEIEENIPPLELRQRLPDECITDRVQHAGGSQQYMSVQQVAAHSIGSLTYGQIPPINYSCRPINSILKVIKFIYHTIKL